MAAKIYYRTRQVAEMVGVHRDTLLRWLRDGKIPEPNRDRNKWRIFTQQEADSVIDYAAKTISETELEKTANYKSSTRYTEQIKKLAELDWDFLNANTDYLNHSIHPYPCKFIPQIPNGKI